jgi:hypothetical protein
MKLIFLHIPKAGGTTFHSIVERFYQKEEIFDIEVDGDRLSTQEFIDCPVETRNNIKLLKGHMKFGLHAYFGIEPFTYVTFLRNPAERIISHYYYILRKKDHYLHNVVTAKKMSLLDFALSDVSEELDNGQLRLLTNHHAINLNCCNEDVFNDAVTNLKTKFSAIGITEKFNESLILVKNKLNWPVYPYYRKLNVSGNKEEKVDQDIITEIEKRNAFDVRLYKFALEKFNNEISEIQDFELQMRVLEGANEAFNAGFCNGNSSGQQAGFNKGYQFALNSNLILRAAGKIKGNLFTGKPRK